jgi:K+/H+ antiporter YhaU regulatory subunit KhtT
MNDTDSTNNPELTRMIEINEALLKSKGRLQNEIIALKKQIEEEGRNQKLITEQIRKINELELLLESSKQKIAASKTENNELAQQLQSILEQKASLGKELERVKHIKWYDKLFGKR